MTMPRDTPLENVRFEKYNMHREDMPWQFRERYIQFGYRKVGMSVYDCIKTPVHFECNETLNIWTHFVPFLLTSVLFWDMCTRQLPILTDSFYWPLALNLFGIMGFCLMSTCAHTFNPQSIGTLHTCFYMDYAFISIYTAGGWSSAYFYARPLDNAPALVNNTPLVVLVCLVISVVSTFQCCCTFRTNIFLEHVMRTSSFVMPWLNCAFPYVYRFYDCHTPEDCNFENAWLFGAHVVFIFIAALAVSTRIPERLAPGAFDIYGHSHQIMHVSAVVSAYCQFECVKREMFLREDRLRTEPINQLYSKYCIYFIMVVAIVDISIALTFLRMRTKYNNYFLKKEQ